jgi:hypothetical protein
VSGAGSLTLVNGNVHGSGLFGVACKGTTASVKIQGGELRGGSSGGIYADGCAVDVDGAWIHGNGGGSGGLAVAQVKLLNSAATIDTTRITDGAGNGTSDPTALYIGGTSSVVVKNTLIGANKGDHAAITLFAGTAVFENSVIAGNVSYTETAGLISDIAGCGVTLRNTVVMDNMSCTTGTCTTGGVHFGQAGCTVTFTDIFHNGAGNVYPQTTYGPLGVPAGFLNVDPQFSYFSHDIPSLGWDFHLRPTSPMRDAGDPASIYNDGATSGTARNDIGMYGGPGSAAGSWYADLDTDGLYDGWEAFMGVDDAGANTDQDGLTVRQEHDLGTHPLISDSDNDGMFDGSDPYPLYFGTP